MSHDFLAQITGSFAMPARENPTVAIVEAAYRAQGLNWRYINCQVSPENPKEAVAGARAMGWAGFNCSIPHKVAVIAHLDALGESARIIGAVNTIVRRGSRLIGENTDGKGFVKAIRETVDPKGKKVVLFGAGVELALADAAQIIVVNRGRDRGETVARLIADNTPASCEYSEWKGPFVIPVDTDIVVHATSVGLYPDMEGLPDIDLTRLRPTMVIADGIHNPPRTPLIRTGEAAGCKTVDGFGMLVNQAVIAISYWTGVDVDASVMRQVLIDLQL
jgi:shikimate dehydrogenase